MTLVSRSASVAKVTAAVGLVAFLLGGNTKCGQKLEGNGTGQPPGHSHDHNPNQKSKECHARVTSFAPGAGSIIAIAEAECKVRPDTHLMQLSIEWAPSLAELHEGSGHEVGFGSSIETPGSGPGRVVQLSVTTHGFCGLGYYYVLLDISGTGGPGFSDFSQTFNSLTDPRGTVIHIRTKGDCF